MVEFRNRVAFLLGDPTHRIPRFSNPAPIVKKKDHDMQDIVVPPGKGDIRIVCPVGDASAVVAKAFLSAVVTGPTKSGTARCWAQTDAVGIDDWSWTIHVDKNLSQRPWRELRNKTTQISIQYDFPEGGTFCIETVSK
jgi:hypothetical protein